jgi:hypothetical protein
VAEIFEPQISPITQIILSERQREKPAFRPLPAVPSRKIANIRYLHAT